MQLYLSPLLGLVSETGIRPAAGIRFLGVFREARRVSIWLQIAISPLFRWEFRSTNVAHVSVRSVTMATCPSARNKRHKMIVPDILFWKWNCWTPVCSRSHQNVRLLLFVQTQLLKTVKVSQLKAEILKDHRFLPHVSPSFTQIKRMHLKQHKVLHSPQTAFPFILYFDHIMCFKWYSSFETTQ